MTTLGLETDDSHSRDISSFSQVDILELLAQQGEDHWLPWQQKRPLLHIACERGAWNCVKYLVSERSDEINQCYDEYYPIHQVSTHCLYVYIDCF